MGQNVSTGKRRIYGRSDYCFVPSFEGSRCCGFSMAVCSMNLELSVQIS